MERGQSNINNWKGKPDGPEDIDYFGQAAFWAMAAPGEQKEVTIENGKEAALTVTTTSGETYGFYGELRILDDGSNGKMADLKLTGWLVGYDAASKMEEMAD